MTPDEKYAMDYATLVCAARIASNRLHITPSNFQLMADLIYALAEEDRDALRHLDSVKRVLEIDTNITHPGIVASRAFGRAEP